MAKKFINKVDEVVDDSLRGLVFSNLGIEFHPNCNRIVLRSDTEEYSSDPDPKVALIAGGGSGHEPYAAGYVGKGMLTAAVAGNVFASPPSRNVQLALERTKTSAGAILFVINYTGDRLNFGLAAERFKASGGNAKVLTIADDVAIDSPNSRVGKRGLAGAVLALKIAGAMAEQDCSLTDIYNYCETLVENMGTLGVSLYPGSLPGKSREGGLGADEVEIGLGIHGEPGKSKKRYNNIHEVVQEIMGTLKEKMTMRTGENFIILINNLGSVSQIEMNIINGEVIAWFKSQNMTISRLFSGIYMTSLDGHGFSVTVLRPFGNIGLLSTYLDAPCTAPGWIAPLSVNQFNPTENPPIAKTPSKLKLEKVEEPISPSEDPIATALIEAVCSSMIESEERLNKLDAAAGDGDCGSTFATAAKNIRAASSTLDKSHPQTLLKQISTIFEQTVGGTSGALYALMFSAAATAFNNNVSIKTCTEALSNANDAIQKYGGAKPGDRTMVDALDAAVNYLKGNSSGDDPLQYWENAVKACEEAAKKTATQKANVGRASYTSSEAQTQPDAGATAIAIWLRAILNGINQYFSDQ